MKNNSLLTAPTGKPVTVTTLNGGAHLANKLDALGIRMGKEVIKIGNSILGGPVTIQVGNTKIALGHGMAARIIVEEK